MRLNQQNWSSCVPTRCSKNREHWGRRVHPLKNMSFQQQKTKARKFSYLHWRVRRESPSADVYRCGPEALVYRHMGWPLAKEMEKQLHSLVADKLAQTTDGEQKAQNVRTLPQS